MKLLSLRLAALFLILLIFNSPFAQPADNGPKENAVKELVEKYGHKWRTEIDGKKGTLKRLSGYGIDLKKEFGLKPNDPASLKRSADRFLSENKEAFRIDAAGLKLKNLVMDKPFWKKHPYGISYLSYEQEYHGIPVAKSNLDITVNNGKIVLIESEIYPDITGKYININPSFSKKDILLIIRNNLMTPSELPEADISPVIFPEETEYGFNYRLAYRAELPLIQEPLGAWGFYIDAITGQVLEKYNNAVSETISGTVTGMFYPEHPSEGQQAGNLKNDEVNVTHYTNVFYSEQGNDLTNSMTITSPISLTGKNNISLNFSAKVITENGPDFARVQASANGADWDSLATYTGSYPDWSDISINLDAYAGGNLWLRFYYQTNNATYYEGFYADNISVQADSETLFSDDAENGSANWTLSGFSITNTELASSSVTEETGYYQVTSDAVSCTINAKLKGPYVEVINADRPNAEHNHSTTIPGTHNWNWSDDDGSYKQEEQNMFYHTNIAHDYFTKGSPFDITGMNYAMKATVQYGTSSGNAFADGTNMYFYGSGTKWESFALLSDVIYHEYAHNAVKHMYGYMPGGSEGGSLNEGWADYFACTINGNHIMAEEAELNKPETYIRTLINTEQYPGVWTGEVHAGGKIIGGALWDLRGLIGADETDHLTISAIKMKPLSFTKFLDNVLIACDDDGDLVNGVPYQAEIITAFTANHAIHSTPILASPGDKEAQENSLLSFTLIAADLDGDIIMYAMTPTSIYLVGATLDPASGVFSWTPDNNQAGTYPVTFIASSTYISPAPYNTPYTMTDSKTINITVRNTNMSPALDYIGNKSVEATCLLSFTVLGNDPDGNAVTYSAPQLPAGASFTPATRTFSWTPSPEQTGNHPAVFRITDIPSDGTTPLSDEEAITITVLNTGPAKAKYPNPANNTANIRPNIQLSWAPGSETLSYNVYFGTNNPPDFAVTIPKTLYRTKYNPAPQSGLTYAATYYWRIDPVNSYGTRQGDIWSFTTVPALPEQAANPVPANETTGQPLKITLGWTGSPDQSSYDVYFGNTIPPRYRTNTASRQFKVSNLQFSTTYYWQINPRNFTGVTQGNLWSFTTMSQETPAQASSPYPYNNAFNYPVMAQLSWASAGDAISYDVYFGPDSNPAYAATISKIIYRTRYYPGALNYNTKYYWRVNAKNTGGINQGAIWSFTTMPAYPGQVILLDPAGEATDCPITCTLSWTPTARAMSYDIYLGTTAPLAAADFKGNTANSQFEISTLQHATTYYWRVDSRNTFGVTTGFTRSFTTAIP